MASSADTATGIQSMPQDILEHIFMLTLPRWNVPVSIGRCTDTLDQSQAPWIFTSVCRVWRTTALARKTLWSRIRINLLDMPAGWMPGEELRILKLCLKRSYPAPISVYFIDKVSEGPEGPAPLYLRLLMQHSSRWERLSTLLSYRHFELLHEVHGKLPILWALEIAPYAPNLLDNVTTFEDAPSLQRVAFLDVPDPALFKLPSDQLTFLGIQMKHSRSSINFLHNTTSLRELSFSNLWPAGHASGHAAIKHQGLERLVTDSLDSLLDVEIPNLETLVIDHPTNSSKNTTTPLSITMFAIRSRFQLTTLSLAAVKYRDRSSIVDLFKNLPHLTHLQIIERDPFNVPWGVVVPVLTWEENNHLLPRLTYLDLQTREPVDSDGLWILMVRSRVRNSAAFASRFICSSIIGWQVSSPGDVLQKKALQMLSDEGFEVSHDMVEVPVTPSPQSPYYRKTCLRNGIQPLTRLQFMTKQPALGSSRISMNTFSPPFIDW